MMEAWRGEMTEVEAVRRRFGDEQSTLLDRFERQSFEVHLNRAMLGRSLSDPTTTLPRTTYAPAPLAPAPPPPLISMVKQGRRLRGLSFQKILKKLLKPIMGRGNKGTARKEVPDPKNFSSWKTFSRSLRV